MEEVELPFQCPYCGQTVTVLVDVSIREQAYIEDCEVCCRPIQIYYQARGGRVRYFSAERTS